MSQITIYKYDPMENGLDNLTGDFQLNLPPGARVVHVAPQRSKDTTPKLWIKLDLDLKREPVNFKIVATGEEMPQSMDRHGDVWDWEYVGTAVCLQGEFVWHLYVEPDMELPF